MNATQNFNFTNILSDTCDFSISDKCKVFDGEKWMKTGDVGNNECYWVNATITGFKQTDNKELLIDVVLEDGRIRKSYYAEGIRHYI